MDIAIIGAGNVGRALATSFSRAGHAVTIASRDPQDAAEAAAATGSTAGISAVEAVAAAGIVVLAVEFASSGEQLAREIAPIVSGKIVVDVTNPLKPTYDGLVTEGGPSAAERFASLAAGGPCRQGVQHTLRRQPGRPDRGRHPTRRLRRR